MTRVICSVDFHVSFGVFGDNYSVQFFFWANSKISVAYGSSKFVHSVGGEASGPMLMDHHRELNEKNIDHVTIAKKSNQYNLATIPWSMTA